MGRTDWDKNISTLLAPQAKYYHCDEVLRLSFYGAKWKGEINEPPIIISVISDNSYKGFDTIVEAASILKKNGKDFFWKVIGIDLSSKLVRCSRRRISNDFEKIGVKLLGRLKAEEVKNELTGSDIFVHPTYIDNSPNSICEAMLIGLPIISTYAGGIPSLLTNNKEGILIQEGEPWTLASRILQLLNNKSIAKMFGQNAALRAAERHYPKKILDSLLHIYEEVKIDAGRV